MQLHDFKVLTFDCYGTLIDWESGMLQALQPLTDQLEGMLSQDAILTAHARHEAQQQLQTPTMPYAELLAVVHKRLAEEWGVPIPWAASVAYGRSVGDWPAFPDTVEALRYLKEHYKLVILSNVDNTTFALSNARLQVTFDAIYTAQDIGSYKPADANFVYLIQQLQQCDYTKADILHTAESLFHDHKPANRHGLHSCWIYRRHDKAGFGATADPGELPHYDFRFTSLADLVAAHQREG